MRRVLPMGRRGGLATALALAATTLAACGGGQSAGQTAGQPASGPGARVAFLLPHPNGDRYEAIDLPNFSERLSELCPNCVLDYYNAELDQEKQNTQFREALAKQPKVMVFDPVDSQKGAELISEAKAKNVPVISYDRILWGKPFDYLVSFDHLEDGRQQARALLEAMGSKASTGQILWINGPRSDRNGVLITQGGHEVLDGKVKIAAEFTSPGPKWGAGVDEWLAKTLPTLDVSTIVGVFASDDGAAGKVAKALTDMGVKTLPPSTGSNADTGALQRILDGSQYMTVYKPVQTEARLAAEVTYDLITGKKPKTTTTIDNEAGQMPAIFVPTYEVTKDKIKETVVKDGFITANALCAAAYSDACKSAGITD